MVEKFQMPRNSIHSTVSAVNPVIVSVDLGEITTPVIPSVGPAIAITKPPRFKPGEITTCIVIGAILVIAVTTIYINKTT